MAPSPSPASNAQDARAREVQAALAERAKRLEADKKAKEAAAKAEAEARAKARREQAAEGSAESSSSNTKATAAERKYADELRHRKQQAVEERRRILRRIEDDRRERKEREAQERQARLLAQAQTGGGGDAPARQFPPPTAAAASRGGGGAAAGGQQRNQQQHEHCNLQVRLFDGSTMRARFPATGTLADDVRPWIDGGRADAGGGGGGGSGPYTFRVVLTPQPNRAVLPAEESDTLASLGLAPSATLVLVPVARFAEAYAGGGAGGTLVWRVLVAPVLGVLAGLYGVLAGLLFGGGGSGGEVRGGPRQRGGRGQGHAGGAGESIALDDLSPAGARGSRIGGFDSAEDRRRRADAQLYNGNSVSLFLPFFYLFLVGRK